MHARVGAIRHTMSAKKQTPRPGAQKLHLHNAARRFRLSDHWPAGRGAARMTTHFLLGARRMDAAPPFSTADTATEKVPMDALVIHGGRRLSGRVAISGAKNAALPVMAATLLAPGVHKLRNVPDLRDTRTFAAVLGKLGAKVTFQGDLCTIDTTTVDSVEAPY